MNQKELIELVKEELTCKSYWKIFDEDQDWSIDYIIIPYLLKHLSNRNQLDRIQKALYLSEIKEDDIKFNNTTSSIYSTSFE